MDSSLFNEEETLFRDSVRRFVEDEIVPHAERWDREAKYPMDIFRKLGELGWLGTAFPEEVGGSGGGSVLYALLCSELGRGSAGVTLGAYVHTALACSAILHLGDDKQRHRYLPKALKGEMAGCWAYAEPDSGADVSRVSTRAELRDGKYVLNGSKVYITNAPFADFMVVVASTNPDKGLKGMSVFVIDRGTEGLSTGPPMEKLGMGASEMSEIFFEECIVPQSALLGPIDMGFLQAMKVLTLGRIAAASFGVGLARAAYENALGHVRVREQFGGVLVRQQFIRFTLADMATRIEAAWQLTLNAARLVDAGVPHDKEASMAKLFSSETCTWVCERALHLCGAQGYMMESPAQRYYRDCKVLDWGEGTSEIQRETIARNLG